MSGGLRMTGLRAWEALGTRVGIVSCLECGAALIIDPDDAKGGVNVVEIHREWHRLHEAGR